MANACVYNLGFVGLGLLAYLLANLPCFFHIIRVSLLGQDGIGREIYEVLTFLSLLIARDSLPCLAKLIFGVNCLVILCQRVD